MEEKLSRSEVSELAIEQRQQIVGQWVSCGGEIADKSGNDTALRLMKFIEDRAVLGIPMPGGYVRQIFLDSPPDQDQSSYVSITPILHEDISRLGLSDERVGFAGLPQAGHIARYNEGSQALYVPGIDLGATARGAIFMHEAMHAHIDIVDVPDRSDQLQHWREEAAVFCFEFDLLRSIGGEEYGATVDRGAGSMTSDDTGRILYKTELVREHGEEAARLFGAVSEHEVEFWSTVVALNSFSEYFACNFSDPDTEFSLFLRRIYPGVTADSAGHQSRDNDF